MKATIAKRVWAEVKEANADFFNLRTVITPDLNDDGMTRFYFTMMPNDGAMAHLNLVGCFYIPEDYPRSPPIVQLFTPTLRYNVDVYRMYLDKPRPASTMCFDILRSEAHYGTWKPEYTLSCLFASLLSAIVSFYVAQEHGGEIAEPVSMERLQAVKGTANQIWDLRKLHFPNPIPRIPLVEATAVHAKSLFHPQKITVGSKTVLTSDPIYLQNGSDDVYSFAVDLSSLHADIIFSVILGNSRTDFVGQKGSTILVRNGVTATAARKVACGPMKWFYHGKPMNDGDMRLHVSVGRDQMTIAYHEDGKLYVHGDTPVSKLDKQTIGDVRDIPFYVHIFTKDKSIEKAMKKEQMAKEKEARAREREQKAREQEEKGRKRKEEKAMKKAEKGKRREEQVRAKGESSSKREEKTNSVEKKANDDEKKANDDEKKAKAKEELEPGTCVIEVLTIDGKGYIHQVESEEEKNDFGFEMVECEKGDFNDDEDEVDGVRVGEPAEDEGLLKKMAGVQL